jgi:hypothetical protein
VRGQRWWWRAISGGVGVVGAVQGGCEWRHEGCLAKYWCNLGVAFVFVKRKKKKACLSNSKNPLVPITSKLLSLSLFIVSFSFIEIKSSNLVFIKHINGFFRFYGFFRFLSCTSFWVFLCLREGKLKLKHCGALILVLFVDFVIR